MSRKKIVILGLDYDGSAGQAAYFNDEELYRFLGRLTSDADLVYIANDSLRQDQYRDLKSLIRNMRLAKTGPHVITGSIFFILPLVASEMRKRYPDREFECLTTLSSALFFNDNNSTELSEEEYKKYYGAINELKHLPEADAKRLKKDPNQIHLWVDAQGYKSRTAHDTSKLLPILLKMHEASLRHPNDDITYCFIDNKRSYGERLYPLFQSHPEIVPSNVSFAYEFLEYDSTRITVDRKNSRSHQIPLKGRGITEEDYVKRLNCAVSAPLLFRLEEPVGSRVDFINSLTCRPQTKLPLTTRALTFIVADLDVNWCRAWREPDERPDYEVIGTRTHSMGAWLPEFTEQDVRRHKKLKHRISFVDLETVTAGGTVPTPEFLDKYIVKKGPAKPSQKFMSAVYPGIFANVQQRLTNALEGEESTILEELQCRVI